MYLAWGWQPGASLVQAFKPASAWCGLKSQSRRLQEDFAAPGKQPPELALGGLGGVLAARSRQGLDRAGARVDQVAGHHAAEAASHHLQRSRAGILPFKPRSKCTLKHQHQGRTAPWGSESPLSTSILLACPSLVLDPFIAATQRRKLLWRQRGRVFSNHSKAVSIPGCQRGVLVPCTGSCPAARPGPRLGRRPARCGADASPSGAPRTAVRPPPPARRKGRCPPCPALSSARAWRRIPAGHTQPPA